MVYALVESGGQQHRVEPGRFITVDRLPLDEGEAFAFDRVLLVRTDDGTTVGQPAVEGATVSGRIKRHLRGDKIHGFKYKAKKRYSRRWGARADLTQITVDAIELNGQRFTAADLDEPVEEPEDTITDAEAQAAGIDDDDDDVADAGVIAGDEDEAI